MRSRPTRRFPRLLTLLAAGAAGVVLAGTGGAAAIAADTPQANHYTGNFTFTKNKADPTHGSISWAWKLVDAQGKTVDSGQKSWRASSGRPPNMTNSCVRMHGWLPDGWYDGLEHSKYWSSTIPTINWELTNQKCPNGTWRTALFIHSKTKAAWNSSSQPYYSEGCIHLSPTDIADADKYSQAHGGPKYGSTRFHHLLHVVGG